MSRTHQPNRRETETIKIPFSNPIRGSNNHILVTFGFDETGRQVREVFCADFRAGTDYHFLAVDACILVSRLLQHGVPVKDLLASVGQPPSLIGVLLEAAVKVEESSS